MNCLSKKSLMSLASMLQPDTVIGMSSTDLPNARRLLLKNKKGFTVLELIVVVVILGLLAAVAIPTFKKVISKSNDSSTHTTFGAFAREVQGIASLDGSVKQSQVDGTTGALNDCSACTYSAAAPGDYAATAIQWQIIPGSTTSPSYGQLSVAINAASTMGVLSMLDKSGNLMIAQINAANIYTPVTYTKNPPAGGSQTILQNLPIAGSGSTGTSGTPCTASGYVCLLAGTSNLGGRSLTYSGDNGLASAASFNQASSMTRDSSGNLYVGENGRIRKISSATGIITTIAGTGTAGHSGDNGPATSALIGSTPQSLRFDSAGNLYFAETNLGSVRKISTSGVITTVAGTGTSAAVSGDNGPATSATLQTPQGIAFDSADNLYVADSASNTVRKVNATTHVITTVVGTGISGHAGDNGPATSATLNSPTALAFDSSGNMYVASGTTGNPGYVRKVSTGGIITTVAGNGTAPDTALTNVGLTANGNNGPATAAAIGTITTLRVAGSTLYIGDASVGDVRKVNLSTGTITGTFRTTLPLAQPGDGAPATNAILYSVRDIALDGSGNLYILDMNAVREVLS